MVDPEDKIKDIKGLYGKRIKWKKAPL